MGCIIKYYNWSGILLFIILLPFITFTTAATTPQPQLTLAQTTHNFGRVKAAGVLEHAFIIKNIGSEKLEITSVTPSCRCIKTDLSKPALAPGETTELTVSFYSKEKKGKFTDFIMVSSNDPERPIVRLRVTGVVERK